MSTRSATIAVWLLRVTLLIQCVVQASMYGSILPAAWSLMLALRARRIASAWTSLHLIYENEVRELIGIPDHYTQSALLPIAYLKGGDLHPAKRLPLSEVAYWNRWGEW